MATTNRDPSTDYGTDSEYRLNRIEDLVGWALTDARRTKEYSEYYKRALVLAAAGNKPEDIRDELERSPDLQELLATDSPAAHDRKQAENRIEEALYKLRTQGIDDAIANKPPQVPTFRA
jgi:hypothetical protein